MHTDVKILYKQIFHAYVAAMQQVQIVRAREMTETCLKEHADTVHAVKQCLKLVKELTTQLNTLERLSTQITCARWMAEVEESKKAEPIRTVYVTASPDIKMMVKTPNAKTEPEKYAEFCRHFGLTEDLINSGAWQVHWPSMVQHITHELTEGKPLPPHCDPNTLYPVYSVTCVKQRDILDAKDMPDAK